MNAVSSWLDAMHAPDKLASTLRSRGPQAAVWVLALALGVQAALIVTRLAGARAPATAAAEPPAPAVVARAIDTAVIANAHLFGAAPVAAPANAADAPRTSMPLVLSATLAAFDKKTSQLLPDRGLAILGPNTNSVLVYAVGDNVPGGARLHAVYQDRVLLERNGSLESLLLPRQVQSAGAPAPVSQPSTFAAEHVRQLISENPGAFAEVIRPQPVFAGGKQRGYRVYPGRNRQAFLRLGLRPGDLVVSINGTPLDDPARGEEIFGTLASASEAHVTVMRNGRTQDLSLNMSQIASEADQVTGDESQSGGSTQTAPPGAGPPALGVPPPPGRY